MSNRSLFAQVLRVSCWIADLLLVSFAVYLALRHQDDLTVQTALALGLCVALGGLLPLGVYFVDYLFAESGRRAEAARGPETLRETMQRLEQLTRRVEDAAEGATKSTLVARQVPDRIEEKLGILEEAAVRLRPESLENVAVGIEQLNSRLATLVKDWDGLKNSLQDASAEDSAVLQQLGEQLPNLTQALASGPSSDGSAPASEAFEARFESMERRLADLMGEIKGMGAALHEVVSADAEELRRISDRLPEQLAEKLAEAAKPAAESVDRESLEQLREAIETHGLLRDEKLEELIDRLNALEAQWAETEWQTIAEEDDEDAEAEMEEAIDEPAEQAVEPLSVPVEDPIVEEVALEEATAKQEVEEAVAEADSSPAEEENARVESTAELEDDWVEEPEDSDVAFLDEEGEEGEEWSEEAVAEDTPETEVPPEEESATPVAEAGIPQDDELTDVVESSETVPEETAETSEESEAVPGEEAHSAEPEAESTPAAKPKSAKARRAEQEMQLFGGDEFEGAPPSRQVAPNHCLVVAKAIIGISNQLYLRGDAPLSWEVGTPLTMTGIGEYQLEVEGLDGPIECEIRLNDDLSALGGTLRLEPGQAITVSPHFPR